MDPRDVMLGYVPWLGLGEAMRAACPQSDSMIFWEALRLLDLDPCWQARSGPEDKGCALLWISEIN